MYGVPQSSVLDDKIHSYADDTTPYSCAEDMSSEITELQIIANKFSSGLKIMI